MKILEISDTTLNKKVIFAVAVLLLSVLNGAGAAYFSPILVLLLNLAIILGIWFIYSKPEVFVGFVLIVRPLLDVTYSTKFLSIGNAASIISDALNPAGILSLCVIGLSFFYFLRGKRRDKTLLPLPGLFYWLLVLWSALSILVSAEKGISFGQWLRMLSIGCFVILLSISNVNTNLIITIWRSVSISSIIPMAVAAYQIIAGKGNLSSGIGFNRAYGTFIHPNPFGHYLVLCMIASYGLYKIYKSRNRLIYMVLFISQMVILFFTYTRGAWIAAAIVLLLLTILMKDKKTLILFCCLAISIIVMIQNNIGSINDRINNLQGSNPTTNSGLIRLLVWKERFEDVKKSPIIGYGIGSANVIAENSSIAIGTHNDYLRVLLETGGVGLIIWILLLMSSFTQLAIAYIKSIRNKWMFLNVSIALAALFAYIIGGFGENLFTTTAYQWYWWALFLPFLKLLLQRTSRGVNSLNQREA